MPYYPIKDNGAEFYEVSTYFEKLVADYMNIKLTEVEELDYIYYLQIKRDAFITKLRQTESGREYLENAYRLTITDMDVDKLRAKFGRKEAEK